MICNICKKNCDDKGHKDLNGKSICTECSKEQMEVLRMFASLGGRVLT